MRDPEIQRAATAKAKQHTWYDIFSADGTCIGSFAYSKSDPFLPNSEYFCAWRNAEEAEIEVYDPKRDGYWRYDIVFTPSQVPSWANRRMSSKLAVKIYNFILRTAEAQRSEITRYKQGESDAE